MGDASSPTCSSSSSNSHGRLVIIIRSICTPTGGTGTHATGRTKLPSEERE